jgi:1-deoxy-D-xylulose-5-phosphate synthase
MEDFIGELTLPEDLKKLSHEQLQEVALALRQHMIKTVADNGGHLAASLGVVELAIALHRFYESPRDKIIWDVGHQSYAHKLLTGRWKEFHTLRRQGGLCGFPKPAESEHDPFLTGHSSTSISAALGLALARDQLGENFRVIAVIGDGALTGGMSFEALNHAGHIKADVTVILNDNKMSIGSNVGSLSAYLGRIRTDPKYSRLKKDFENYVTRVPHVGKKLVETAERIKGGLKYLIMPGMLFEELGFTYFGPVDGHDLTAMANLLKQADKMRGPVLVHVVTEKGKGYHFAEIEPEIFHGIGPFDLNNGVPFKNKKIKSYTDHFSHTLVELARSDPKIVAITAAMAIGTGLKSFSKEFPDRFYDVGIAEQHAVTMAAALAAGGMRPVFAVYSTFLQRAYDQLIHDTCLQNLPVVFAVDRAGIVGEDGETHQGLFDLSFLRSIPNMTIMAPANEKEQQNLLYTALQTTSGPIAIRYPRDKVTGIETGPLNLLPWGKGELVRQGLDLLIVAAGTVLQSVLEAAERLAWQNIKAAVINTRFVKPLDEKLIVEWARKCRMVITVEENILSGGFGSGVVELLEKNDLFIPVRRLGVDDQFVGHGTRSQMLKCQGLDAEGIYDSIIDFTSIKKAKIIN